MMKSNRMERKAIAARLREALKHTKNSDIEATLNAILDLDNIEAEFLKLHQKCESIYFHECLEIAYRQQGKNIDIDKKRQDFVYAFNDLSEIFRNHPDVQRDRKETDDNVDSFSKGTSAVVRGRGVASSSSSSSSPFCGTTTISKYHCGKCGHLLLSGTNLCNNCSITQSNDCTACGSILTKGDKHKNICNPCHNVLWNIHSNCIYCSTLLTPGRQLPDTCDWCSQSINAFGVGKKISQVIPSCNVCNCTLTPFDKSPDTCNQCAKKASLPPYFCGICGKHLKTANISLGTCFMCQSASTTFNTSTGTIKDCSVCGSLLAPSNLFIGKCAGCQAAAIKICSDCKNPFTPDKAPTKCNHCVLLDNITDCIYSNVISVNSSMGVPNSVLGVNQGLLNNPSTPISPMPVISKVQTPTNPPKKISLLDKSARFMKKLVDSVTDASIE